MAFDPALVVAVVVADADLAVVASAPVVVFEAVVVLIVVQAFVADCLLSVERLSDLFPGGVFSSRLFPGCED